MADGGIGEPGSHEVAGGGLPGGDHFGAQHFDELGLNGGVLAAGTSDEVGAEVGGFFEFAAIPLFGMGESPGRGLISVAFVAGVGDAVLDGQAGVGDGVAVIVARVALHVGGGGHVAVDAVIAGGAFAVMAVQGGNDDGGGTGERGGTVVFLAGEVLVGASGVALHAEGVAGELGFAGVGVVAIDAADTGVVHFAAEKGGGLVVFIADLAVGVEDVGKVGDGEGVVIVEGGAGDHVASEFAAAGVAGGAGFEHLIAREFREVRVFEAGGGLGGLLLPSDVGFHRAVAGLARDGHFCHAGVVRVGGGIEIFA